MSERGQAGPGRALRTREVAHERLLALLAQRRERARFGEDRPSLTPARPPAQPTSGPGGSEYPHRRLKSNLFGGAELAYWTFEPSDPTPAEAPVVALLHGWGGGSPARVGAWIEHLVRRGHTVVFPVYQGSLNPLATPWERVPPSGMAANAAAAVREALRRLDAGRHVRPQPGRFAVLGVSRGGALAAQLAAQADRYGIPRPRAVMPILPSRGVGARHPLPPVSLGTIDPSTLMVVVVGDCDKNAGDREARAIMAATSQVPAANKNLVLLVSDYHGTPALVANHHSPVAASAETFGLKESDLRSPSTLHYFGYWKLLDGLLGAAFTQRHRAYALGNTPEQRFMGVWSDGVPVQELRVLAGAGAAPLPAGPRRARRWR